jgi:hypothetical protein
VHSDTEATGRAVPLLDALVLFTEWRAGKGAEFRSGLLRASGAGLGSALASHSLRSGAFAVDWNGYEVFDPGIDRPLVQLRREEARAAFDRLMAARDQRLVQLHRLATANGVDLDAVDGVQRLNDWFVASVEPAADGGGRLAEVWYSVVNDIGLFLGERAIAASGNKLHWELFTAGKKDMAYQRHVLMGFAVPNRRYNIDPDLLVGMYGHRVVRGENVDPEYFVKLLRAAAERS